MSAEIADVEIVGPDVTAAVTLFGTDNPGEALEHAAQVAVMLADLVRKQHLVVKIGASEHVRVEGWTTLGSILGVFPVVEWTRPFVMGDGVPWGWEARVEARTRRGEVVGSGEAMCTRDEKTWARRDDYALRSMAQTRAVSKALRMPLGFVMQLAGFNPTPAEEMPDAPRGTVAHPEGEVVDDGRFPPHPDVEMPAVAVISDAQRRRLRAIQKRVGMSDERLKQLVFEVAGVYSSKLIPLVRYDDLIATVEADTTTDPAGFQLPESLR